MTSNRISTQRQSGGESYTHTGKVNIRALYTQHDRRLLGSVRAGPVRNRRESSAYIKTAGLTPKPFKNQRKELMLDFLCGMTIMQNAKLAFTELKHVHALT